MDSDLNKAQKASLAVTLRVLEERLLTIKMLLQSNGMDGRVHGLKKDITEDDEKRLLSQIEIILQTLRQMADTFAIAKKTEKLSDILRAFKAYAQTVLIDEKADKLKRYGKVSPTLAEKLDPLISKLIAQIEPLDQPNEREQTDWKDNQHRSD